MTQMESVKYDSNAHTESGIISHMFKDDFKSYIILSSYMDGVQWPEEI